MAGNHPLNKSAKRPTDVDWWATAWIAIRTYASEYPDPTGWWLWSELPQTTDEAKHGGKWTERLLEPCPYIITSVAISYCQAQEDERGNERGFWAGCLRVADQELNKLAEERGLEWPEQPEPLPRFGAFDT